MIMYLCNGERPACSNPSCKNEADICHCKYTSDLVYAKNWDHEPTDEELKVYFNVSGKATLDPDWYEHEKAVFSIDDLRSLIRSWIVPDRDPEDILDQWEKGHNYALRKVLKAIERRDVNGNVN